MLLCNQVSRVIEPLTSRCAKLRFAPISSDAIMQNLARIVNAERITITGDINDCLRMIAEKANGDMRSAINLLQSASIMSESVSVDVIETVSGDIPNDTVSTIYQAILDGKPVAHLADLLNLLIYRQSHSASKMVTRLVDRMVEDMRVADAVKARVAVYAGVVDARSGNEYMHLMALVAYMHDCIVGA
jgi:DNA polymerase III delta prime subunit